MVQIKRTFKKSKTLVKIVRKARKLFYPATLLFYPFQLKKANINYSKPQSNVLNQKNRGKNRIIISLTSFPNRIDFVHKPIKSIMNQTYQPDLIILWLSESEFPKKEEELPTSLLELKAYGLEIRWTKEDLKSYKKLVPALISFPKDIIVTADDDLYYPVNWLENLVRSYEKYPQDIHCHLITRISYRNELVKVVPRDKKYINDASYNNKILGGSGTLYPPNTLANEVLNINKMKELAPTSDDLWFWGAALKKGTKIRWIKNNMKKLYYIEYSQHNDTLSSINDQGEKLFYKHIANIIDYYQIAEVLKN